MGPRAFAHGDLAEVKAFQMPELVLQWGRGLSPTETRFFVFEVADFNLLQWGRGLSPTETAFTDGWLDRLPPASMGPRAFAHGDSGRSGHAAMAQSASMGPRAFAHGDALGPKIGCRRLQSFNGAAGFRPRRRLRPTFPREPC